MLLIRTILSVLIITLFLSSCSQLSQAPLATPRPADPLGTWTLKMDHSGGIMGLSRSIEISSDGSYVVRDERIGKTTNGQLSADELETLNGLLNSINPASVPDARESNCADCFVYAIDFQSEDKSLKTQVDDMTLEASGLEPLISFLRGIMDKNL